MWGSRSREGFESFRAFMVRIQVLNKNLWDLKLYRKKKNINIQPPEFSEIVFFLSQTYSAASTVKYFSIQLHRETSSPPFLLVTTEKVSLVSCHIKKPTDTAESTHPGDKMCVSS